MAQPTRDVLEVRILAVKRNNIEEVAKRRAAMEQQLGKRREEAKRCQEEKLARAFAQKEEILMKQREIQRREMLRAKAALDRRTAFLAEEKERKAAVLERAHATASRLSSLHKPKSMYAFGSSTPRELEYLTQLTKEQKVYDRRLQPPKNCANYSNATRNSSRRLSIPNKDKPNQTMMQSLYVMQSEPKLRSKPMQSKMARSVLHSPRNPLRSVKSSSNSQSSDLSDQHGKMGGRCKHPSSTNLLNNSSRPSPLKQLRQSKLNNSPAKESNDSFMVSQSGLSKRRTMEVAKNTRKQLPFATKLKGNEAKEIVSENDAAIKLTKAVSKENLEFDSVQNTMISVNLVVKAIPDEMSSSVSLMDRQKKSNILSVAGCGIATILVDERLYSPKNSLDIYPDFLVQNGVSSEASERLGRAPVESLKETEANAENERDSQSRDTLYAPSQDFDGFGKVDDLDVVKSELSGDYIENVVVGDIINLNDQAEICRDKQELDTIDMRRLACDELVQQNQREREERKAKIASIMSRTRGAPTAIVNPTSQRITKFDDGIKESIKGLEPVNDSGSHPFSQTTSSVLQKLAASNPRLLSVLQRNTSNPSLADELSAADPSITLADQIQEENSDISSVHPPFDSKSAQQPLAL